MKKLILAFAGLSVIGATAQEVRTDLGRSSEMYTASHADGIPYKTSANISRVQQLLLVLRQTSMVPVLDRKPIFGRTKI